MTKIVFLNSEQRGIIELLKDALSMAERGELKGIVISGILDHEDDTALVFGRSNVSLYDLYTLIGHQQAMASLLAVDDRLMRGEGGE